MILRENWVIHWMGVVNRVSRETTLMGEMFWMEPVGCFIFVFINSWVLHNISLSDFLVIN